jgi:hypothetical protein
MKKNRADEGKEDKSLGDKGRGIETEKKGRREVKELKKG